MGSAFFNIATPLGVTFVSAPPQYNPTTCVWNVGGLAASVSTNIGIQVSVDPGTACSTIVNTGMVANVNEVDQNPANNSANASIMVECVDVGVTKTVNDGTPIEGQTIQ